MLLLISILLMAVHPATWCHQIHPARHEQAGIASKYFDSQTNIKFCQGPRVSVFLSGLLEFNDSQSSIL